MRMTGRELQANTRGIWHGVPSSEVFGLSTDTRSLKKGSAFLALRGPRFDGHRFGADAMANGASILIGDTQGNGLWQSMQTPRLEVKDTLDALGDIAGAWRRQLSATVVAITGSYGKTSVRSMLEYALRHMGLHVTATKANDNNLIGVPQTLLSIEDDADIAVVECGISEAGEMKRLASMVQPDIAIMVGLAPAHVQGLGDLHGVAQEKGVLLQHLTENGCAMLGSGVSAIMRNQDCSPNVFCIDMDDTMDNSVVRWKIQRNHCLLQLSGETATVELDVPAWHQAANMALVATVIHHLRRTEIGEIADALSGWRTAPGRMQRLQGIDESIIIHDAYNANPASMHAALDTLKAMQGRHFAVLGDMAELGKSSQTMHAELDVSGLESLILVGQQMKALADVCTEAQWFPDVETAISVLWVWNLRKDDVVLIKGSRCMKLEAVVNVLIQGRNADAI